MSKTLKYLVYLFDGDGPLIDSADAALAATNRVLDSFELETMDLETWRAVQKPPWDKFYANRGVPKDQVGEALRRYSSFFNELRSRTTSPAEVRETLHRLQRRRVAVITDMSRKSWEEYCRRFDFDGIEVVVTRDDCKERKPSSNPLILAMENLGISKKKIRAREVRGIMVGDSSADIIAGKNAGLDTAAIVYSGSYNNRERLLKQKPTYLIPRIGIIADRDALQTYRISDRVLNEYES